MGLIIFISSDPGVTNALIPVARHLKAQGARVKVIASGPAAMLWEKDEGGFDLDNADDLMGRVEIVGLLREFRPSVVVTGAGAYNMIEHNFRACARDLCLPSFAIMDYWAHYPERFRRKIDGVFEQVIPDQIGVMDELCRTEMIAAGFAPEKLVIVGAPHLEEAVDTIRAMDKETVNVLKGTMGLDKDIRTVAFFSQTVNAPENDIKEDRFSLYERPPLGFTQRTTLKEILLALSDVSEQLKVRTQLIVKSHPREPIPLKYVVEDVKVSAFVTCHMIEDLGVAKLIGLADVVLSLTSTALLEASLAGKLSLSVQIERDFKSFPDMFYGNRMGLSISVTQRQELREWFKKVIGLQEAARIPSGIDFSGSIRKTGMAIMELANTRNTGDVLWQS